LTEAQRQQVRTPIGELVTGTTDECTRALAIVLEAEKPSRLILVGDTVSRYAIEFGIRPTIMIIDNKEKRAQAIEFAHKKQVVFRTKNAAGTIELDAWKNVEEAIGRGDCAVIVDGEEDLLTLVAVLVAPVGSLVVYGQPGQGIVLVRITPEKKREIEMIIEQMDRME
jgi:uncharacterized protein (UPF0218 family)